MKKLYLTLLCATALTCGSFIARAEEDLTMPPPPSQMIQDSEIAKNFKKHHEEMKNKLSEELKMTDEQKQKAQEMRKKAREQMKPLIDKMKELREEMDKIRSDNMKDFEKILTDEQKEVFNKIKAERKARHEEMMKKHHFRPQPPMPME